MTQRNNVMLPLAAPDTEALRKAVANIIRDIQREFEETDQQTADRLGVRKNTIANARNRLTDLGALTIARIGAIYGAEFLGPYRALYELAAPNAVGMDSAPLEELAETMSALCKANGPKARLDTLPTVKNCAEKLNGYVAAMERWRLSA